MSRGGYDFFRPDLWDKRIRTIDNVNDTTYHLLQSVIATVDGFTAATLERFIAEADAGEFRHLRDLVARLEAAGRIPDSEPGDAIDMAALSRGRCSRSACRHC